MISCGWKDLEQDRVLGVLDGQVFLVIRERGFGEAMAPDTNRRSLRSLRSDRDDSKERGVAVYTAVSLPGHP